jgi:tRNA threonylcarbamoyladenosine biosynthesis protein TsaE
MAQEFLVNTPEALAPVVAALVKQLAPGMVVFLEGDLGAGKTTLVRMVMEQLGSPDLVSSPSFSLINIYHTERFPVAHFDLYRLDTGSDLEVIGAEEYLNGAHLLFVEWPERVHGFFPAPAITIRFQILEDGLTRQVRLEGGTA